MPAMGSMNYNGFAHDHFALYSNGMPSSSAVPHPDGATETDARGPGAGSSVNDPGFDILEWFPAYQSCQRYFLDHAQHEAATQAVCALINIRLPFQWLAHPVASAVPMAQNSGPAAAASTGGAGSSSTFTFTAYPQPVPASGNHSLNSPNGLRSPPNPAAPEFVSPIPYIRRLVVTGFDKPAILHGFFGDDFNRGIMPHVECERRNYLFAAKHGGWRSCKKQYDTGSGGGVADETVPFLKPLDGATPEELAAAEKAWSSWLCMEDWMVGPRAPAERGGGDDHTEEQREDGGGGVRMEGEHLQDRI